MRPSFYYERKLWKQGYKAVIGADEVGRGAFAGPIVAGAVVFAPAPQIKNLKIKMQNDGIIVDDSKKLTTKQREKAAAWIKENAAAWGVGEASVSLINRLGMGKATRMAFRRAIAALMEHVNLRQTASSGGSSTFGSLNPKSASAARTRQPSALRTTHSSLPTTFLLIDAFYLPYTRGLRRKRQLAIVNGDEKCFSIAAASILAKVHRDKLMRRLSKKHPKYAWDSNKGYGTREHRGAIRRHGITRLHRRQFVSRIMNNEVSRNT